MFFVSEIFLFLQKNENESQDNSYPQGKLHRFAKSV